MPAKIEARVFKEDTWPSHGYGRWFYEIKRGDRIVARHGGHYLESHARRDLSSMARFSNFIGEEAYALDCVAHPKYPDGTPRKPWAELGKIEKLSWENRHAEKKA